jgi:hypothetical protein
MFRPRMRRGFGKRRAGSCSHRHNVMLLMLIYRQVADPLVQRGLMLGRLMVWILCFAFGIVVLGSSSRCEDQGPKEKGPTHAWVSGPISVKWLAHQRCGATAADGGG